MNASSSFSSRGVTSDGHAVTPQFRSAEIHLNIAESVHVTARP